MQSSSASCYFLSLFLRNKYSPLPPLLIIIRELMHVCSPIFVKRWKFKIAKQDNVQLQQRILKPCVAVSAGWPHRNITSLWVGMQNSGTLEPAFSHLCLSSGGSTDLHYVRIQHSKKFTLTLSKQETWPNSSGDDDSVAASADNYWKWRRVILFPDFLSRVFRLHEQQPFSGSWGL